VSPLWQREDGEVADVAWGLTVHCVRYIVFAILVFVVSPVDAAPPVVADQRLMIELVAQEPDLVTPTGVAVDERGRIWVIENHTHQRPAKYQGPPSDRIRIFEDFGPGGKARKITTFAEDFRDTMGIALGKDGAVFVATRSTIYLLRDTKGTGQADVKKVLAHLDTKADYPHNGLSGFAIDALGDLHFGLGENFGADYKLIGSDKWALGGGGEGGSIYRMHADGTGLVRLATGFWNPFHMAFDRWGRLFAVDNDPDARGPCRLLHIVPGGDYGYRFRYGRKGIHPFQSWNGELPGTLPMVAGTAEAPSGIVAYESNGLPEEYRRHLLVTSWGDHVIELFQLEPRGASFGAKKKILARGGEDFRPVGIALAPDGSVIVSDWVDKSYPVHGKGRLWRIRMKEPPKAEGLDLGAFPNLPAGKLAALMEHPRQVVRAAAAEALAGKGDGLDALQRILRVGTSEIARLQALWTGCQRFPEEKAELIGNALTDASPHVRAGAAALAERFFVRDYVNFGPMPDLAMKDPSPYVRALALQADRSFLATERRMAALDNDDPFFVHAALEGLKRHGVPTNLEIYLKAAKTPRMRLGILLLARDGPRTERSLCGQFLSDPDPAIRRTAIQWVAEDNLTQFAKEIDKAAVMAPVSRDVFEAWLAAQQLLAHPGQRGDPSKEPSGDLFVLKVLKDAQQPVALRTLALHMLPPRHPGLKLPELLALAKDPDAALRVEALRTLTWRTEPGAQSFLRDVAADVSQELALRADAVLGLAHSAATDAATRKLLLQLVDQRRACLTDALRSLRGALAPGEEQFFEPWWRAVQRDVFFDNAARDELAEQALLTLGQGLAPKGEPAAGIALTMNRPATVEAWRDFLLPGKGDAAGGERVFFHDKGPRCFACHKIDGRGEAIGPDLSHVGAALTRARLIESILEPSKEIAPAFVTWLVTTRDGKQHVGVILGESFDSTLMLADAQGKRTVLKITDVEERVAQTTSIMPADLHAKMTRQEFLDLLAFLESRK
jgi:putative membrane-bound dehydrogenase-like protein